MKLKIIFSGALLVIALGLPSAALADKANKDDYKDHPGYVDFAALDVIGDQEAKVEVFLKNPLLELVSKVLQHEEPELYEIMGQLKLVRVQVYDIDSDLAEKIGSAQSTTAKELDKRGWERVVRIRDDDERVDVYLKPSDDYQLIQGIVVMVLENDGEAVFVNIVGDLNPEDISKLGEHFDIDALDDIHYKRRH